MPRAALLKRHESRESYSVETAEREGYPGAWTVEAIGSDGEIYQAIFAGPEARVRAEEYAKLKYGQ